MSNQTLPDSGKKNITRTYLNQRFSGSYSGLSGFIKNRKTWKDRKVIDEELRKLDAYSLHRPVRRKFQRRKILVNFIGEIFASDLKDISSISQFNRGYTFVLVVVDGFSKKAYTRLLKDKSGKTMLTAFKSIFKEAGMTPNLLFVDQGTEYKNKTLQSYLKEKKVVTYHIYSAIKSSFAERFIRTLWTKIERYKTARNTNTIYDIIPILTKTYNSTFHRTIGTTPNSVTKDNEAKIWDYMYRQLFDKKFIEKNSHQKYKVGDVVRITRAKLIFEKGTSYIILFQFIHFNFILLFI